ncbi:MAG: regulatory iron-sulfur-containing complex subunit RicT [Bacillota bacterium]|nr:regulatory iron-sulfur-containing complex subunit RicT [Bacillota bacterium]
MNEERVRVIGVRFRLAGPVAEVTAGELEPVLETAVVVAGERGEELARVVRRGRWVPAAEGEGLPRVVRLATASDLEADAENRRLADEAFSTCAELIEEEGLAMHLVDARYNLDRSHLLFSFTAPERVDFRHLVRQLATRFRTRIELRQVGPRDAARLLGGIGPCGRILCCTSFLREFNTVTVRMAKAQALALNPESLSGLCGRLKCCLRYEWTGGNQGGGEADAKGELLTGVG